MQPVTPPIIETKIEPPKVDLPSAKSATCSGEDAASDEAVRSEKAKKLIRRNVYWALGFAAIPVPLVDVAGVFAAQIKMLRELTTLYGMPFSESRAKAIVSALITTIGGNAIATAVVGSLLKAIPVVGTAMAIVTMPIVGAAVTQTLGNLFMMHFESGGTLLDFDAAAMRDHFKQEFEKNKLVVEEIRRGR